MLAGTKGKEMAAGCRLLMVGCWAVALRQAMEPTGFACWRSKGAMPMDRAAGVLAGQEHTLEPGARPFLSPAACARGEAGGAAGRAAAAIR